MEIINSHAHIYPEKIAEKATNAIGDFYDISMETPTGTTSQLICDGKKIGTTKYVVHSVATTAHQVFSINRFIKSEMDKHLEFIGFMTLQHELTEEQVNEEVEWCYQNGFSGVKIHPDFQKVDINDEKMTKIYNAVGCKFPILFHVGDNRFDYSKPEKLVEIAKKYPKMNFIAAHFGGYRCWDKYQLYKGLDNVYFDTSSSLPFITPEHAKNIIDFLGVEKFFFATDFPMWGSENELERFMKIKLSDDDREKIFAKNIKNLLKI